MFRTDVHSAYFPAQVSSNELSCASYQDSAYGLGGEKLWIFMTAGNGRCGPNTFPRGLVKLWSLNHHSSQLINTPVSWLKHSRNLAFRFTAKHPQRFPLMSACFPSGPSYFRPNTHWTMDLVRADEKRWPTDIYMIKADGTKDFEKGG
ncbi:hypothetical protein RRG08_007781 [Elysia crispata]|uniref:Uncharacterized protein n=1 Tax=Elysia crispata TaxID=231223 RepID=A0AAE1E9C6_9GAST|nr:hypothetical protein RRG08_007781 [Elysia crispata]